ncbi:sigma adaptin [Heterostelium album PN500]|uniref:Sigma adaptin n=1 Tax=Heterostelium pallidum (strain ATCC 26659 / Pp 5 / PN500) TaxID=670386 RepID=D3AWY6_HETP5|nr:sigma adaptin [Heterostelium album PN500]EFA86809.1 sigma adaptin [Heterostelium album PN500]|eukprot:XP_020438912.1 sigma adaptin [Heterostelium album PN500]
MKFILLSISNSRPPRKKRQAIQLTRKTSGSVLATAITVKQNIAMIKAILIINNHGKARLTKFYEHVSVEKQQQIIRDLFLLVSKRSDRACNFLEVEDIFDKDTKIIYRHYATLYFIFVVDSSESELSMIDLIQTFVETLDKCFENVCELHLIFHIDKVHYILDEIVMGGLVLETNPNIVVSNYETQNKIEKSENPLLAGFQGTKMTGSWVFFAMGAIVAKAVPAITFIEGGWRYMGGASIVFHGIKTYVFGKLIRTIEYPDGEMVSIIVRTNNINRLKNEILKHQPALFPGVQMDSSDVKFISRWTPPHFTEPCSKNRDLKMVPDGGVIFWSRFEPIPKRNVTLDIKDKELLKLDQAIQFVHRLGKTIGSGVVEETARLTSAQENALIDLLLEKDEGVLALHRNFNQYPSLFKYHALRYLTAKGKLIDKEVVQQQQQTVQQTTQQTTSVNQQQQAAQQQKQQQAAQQQKQQQELLKQQQQQQNQEQQKSPTQAPSPHELTNTV